MAWRFDYVHATAMFAPMLANSFLANWPEYSLYAIYFLVGPGMWGLYAIGMYQAQKRMELIKHPRDPVPEPAPSVTILVPAKDEQERIGDCLRSALAQKYPNFK